MSGTSSPQEERHEQDEGLGIVTEARVNQLPVAHVTVNETGTIGEIIVMDGTGSQDDGFIMTFSWRQIEGPRVALRDSSSATATFLSRDAGRYVVELVVTDDQGSSTTAIVVIAVEDVPQRLEGARGAR